MNFSIMYMHGWKVEKLWISAGKSEGHRMHAAWFVNAAANQFLYSSVNPS
jgi:hypothetical protein